MRSGKLRNCIEIQRAKRTPNEYGEQETTYETKAHPWHASIENVGGQEQAADGRAAIATNTFNLTLRYFPGLTTADRILFKGRILNIVNINNVDERNREHHLVCVEVPGESP